MNLIKPYSKLFEFPYTTLLLLITFIACSDLRENKPTSFSHKWNKSLPTIGFYYGSSILPIERGKAGCRKPNAILEYSTSSFPEAIPFCIDSKVTKGLIYDSITKQEINSEIVTAGQSFVCLCPNDFKSVGYTWKKAKTVNDLPIMNPDLITIFSTRGSGINFDLEYRLHYRIPENLFCISTCRTFDRVLDEYVFTTTYQLLKIR